MQFLFVTVVLKHSKFATFSNDLIAVFVQYNDFVPLSGDET
jgi:hypothetical protein